MGAAACTLLWGVSSSEEVVTAILGGVSVTRAVRVAGQGASLLPFIRQMVWECQLCGVRGDLALWMCHMDALRARLSPNLCGVRQECHFSVISWCLHLTTFNVLLYTLFVG